MKNLKDFKGNEISNANNVKGGVFCEWYINQRSGTSGNTSNAIILMENVDGVMVENGNEKFA